MLLAKAWSWSSPGNESPTASSSRLQLAQQFSRTEIHDGVAGGHAGVTVDQRRSSIFLDSAGRHVLPLQGASSKTEL